MTNRGSQLPLSRRALLALGAALGLPGVARGAQAGRSRLVAWIEAAQTGRVTEFRAMAASGVAGEAEFELTAEFESGGGRTRSRQGGKVRLEGDGAPEMLSRVALNIGEGGTYHVRVDLRGSDGAISTAELSGSQETVTEL
ncbi:MAG: curli-like amyloid fiber formation chaperone CsgH [Pseudomonadota bacterium]